MQCEASVLMSDVTMHPALMTYLWSVLAEKSACAAVENPSQTNCSPACKSSAGTSVSKDMSGIFYGLDSTALPIQDGAHIGRNLKIKTRPVDT